MSDAFEMPTHRPSQTCPVTISGETSTPRSSTTRSAGKPGLVGIGRFMWSSDYPHGNTTWPHSREVIERDLGHSGRRSQQAGQGDGAAVVRHEAAGPVAVCLRALTLKREYSLGLAAHRNARIELGSGQGVSMKPFECLVRYRWWSIGARKLNASLLLVRADRRGVFTWAPASPSAAPPALPRGSTGAAPPRPRRRRRQTRCRTVSSSSPAASPAAVAARGAGLARSGDCQLLSRQDYADHRRIHRAEPTIPSPD